jgi:hypothetical protein
MFRVYDPIGPLFFEGKDEKQKSFYFNSTEILFVNHVHADEMPVFAFCSEQGEVFHVVLCQTDLWDSLVMR